MKKTLTVLGSLALLAATAQLWAQETPPPPLPTLDISTMLFLMLIDSGQQADSADPIDINAFDIDFGDDGNAAADAVVINDLLQRR